MKKAVLLFATILLIFSQLAACGQRGDDRPEDKGSEPVTLNVCVDLRESGGRAVSDLLLSTPGAGTEFTVLTETIPEEGADRENALTRIRTEILAGKGPDVFICDTALMRWEGPVLFPFPRQVMENRVFLPLDSYLEKAGFIEWDKFLPKIMEAGRNEEGQQLLPMGYELKMFVAEKSLGEPEFSCPLDEGLNLYMPFYDVLGEFADYGKDELALTEEELFKEYKEQIDAFKAVDHTQLPVQIAYVTDGGLMVMGENQPELLDLDKTEYWMMSGKNLSGGATADITAFAGINRNTGHPEEAFKVVDFLLSRENQAGSAIYNNALPVHADLYSKEAPWHGSTMSEGNFEQFKELRDSVSAAKFYTPLESLVYEGWDLNADEGKLRELVHKAYMKMNMYLAES